MLPRPIHASWSAIAAMTCDLQMYLVLRVNWVNRKQFSTVEMDSIKIEASAHLYRCFRTGT